MYSRQNKIDYQINKILYHFKRLEYLRGVEEALKALDSAGFLSVKKPPTKSTKAPARTGAGSAEENGRPELIERQNQHEAKTRANDK